MSLADVGSSLLSALGVAATYQQAEGSATSSVTVMLRRSRVEPRASGGRQISALVAEMEIAGTEARPLLDDLVTIDAAVSAVWAGTWRVSDTEGRPTPAGTWMATVELLTTSHVQAPGSGIARRGAVADRRR